MKHASMLVIYAAGMSEESDESNCLDKLVFKEGKSAKKLE
jgi:hypothetical protein